VPAEVGGGASPFNGFVRRHAAGPRSPTRYGARVSSRVYRASSARWSAMNFRAVSSVSRPDASNFWAANGTSTSGRLIGNILR